MVPLPSPLPVGEFSHIEPRLSLRVFRRRHFSNRHRAHSAHVKLLVFPAELVEEEGSWRREGILGGVIY